MSGWQITDLISPRKIPSQQDALGGRHQISINNSAVIHQLTSNYYWAAPQAYLGNKVHLRQRSRDTLRKNLHWHFKSNYWSLECLTENYTAFTYTWLEGSFFYPCLAFCYLMKWEIGSSWPVIDSLLCEVLSLLLRQTCCPLGPWFPGSHGPPWSAVTFPFFSQLCAYFSLDV